MSMKPKNEETFSYTRKSSDENSGRQVQSIEDQAKEVKRLSERYKLPIPDTHFLSEEMSAKKPGRPVFNGLMERVERNDHTTIFCWHLNRLTRNPIDEGRIKWLLQQGKLTIITPTQVFDVNTNAILTGVEAGKGAQDIIELSRGVKRGLQSKRDKGIFPAVAPPGYINKGKEKGNKWIAADPKRFPLVQRALQRVLRGIEPMESLRALNEDEGFRTIKRRKLGGGPLAEASWYEMLRNPMYCGWCIAYKNTPREHWYKGIHPPMITEEEYWSLQEILGKRGRTRPHLPADDSYLGMFACGECQSAITRDSKRYVYCRCKKKYSVKNRDACPHCGLHMSKVAKAFHHEYSYLRCTKQRKDKNTREAVKCGQSYLPVAEFETQIASLLGKVEIPQEFINWALESLAEQNDEEVKTQEEILASLQGAYEGAQKQLYRLNELYLKGSFEDEGGEREYDERKQKLEAEKSSLKQQLDKFDTASDDWRDKTEQVYVFAKYAKEWFIRGDRRTRIQILASLGADGVIRNKTASLELHAPFATIKNALGDISHQFPSVEPKNIAVLCTDVRQQPLVAAIKSTWLRGSEQVRTKLALHNRPIFRPEKQKTPI